MSTESSIGLVCPDCPHGAAEALSDSDERELDLDYSSRPGSVPGGAWRHASFPDLSRVTSRRGSDLASRPGSHGAAGSRPASQRSHDTLRRVSSLLFIATPATKKRIDKARLNELDSSTLVDLIKDYMSENQELRKENTDLFSIRDMMVRDQELVCKENERLLKKLEDVNS